MDYQTFSEIFNRFVFGTSKAKLLENIAENPERYLGIFRPTKPKTKLLCLKNSLILLKVFKKLFFVNFPIVFKTPTRFLLE